MLTEKDLQSRKLPELKELGSKLEIPKAKRSAPIYKEKTIKATMKPLSIILEAIFL